MIGIFDSGYGGLTVMKEIVRELPQYDYMYLGDNARTPYGNRSQEMVTQFADEAVQFLFGRGARLIIFACNTASALALRELQEKYLRNPKSPFRDRKILGVVRPVVEKAAAESKSGRIGVIGTRGTVGSGVFEKEIKKLRPEAAVMQQACPLLVPIIEEGWHQKPEALMILKKYLRPLKNNNVDTLVPGCTHYPLMMKDITRMMGKQVKVLDSGKIVAESLKNYLQRHTEIESQLTRGGSRTFFTTDDATKFAEFGKKFAEMEIARVEKIALSRGE